MNTTTYLALSLRNLPHIHTHHLSLFLSLPLYVYGLSYPISIAVILCQNNCRFSFILLRWNPHLYIPSSIHSLKSFLTANQRKSFLFVQFVWKLELCAELSWDELSSYLKMGQPLPLFRLFLVSFQTSNTIFTTNQCEKMSTIQYMAPGFKPTTS